MFRQCLIEHPADAGGAGIGADDDLVHVDERRVYQGAQGEEFLAVVGMVMGEGEGVAGEVAVVLHGGQVKRGQGQQAAQFRGVECEYGGSRRPVEAEDFAGVFVSQRSQGWHQSGRGFKRCGWYPYHSSWRGVGVLRLGGHSAKRSKLRSKAVSRCPHPPFGHLPPQAGEGLRCIGEGERSKLRSTYLIFAVCRRNIAALPSIRQTGLAA